MASGWDCRKIALHRDSSALPAGAGKRGVKQREVKGSYE